MLSVTVFLTYPGIIPKLVSNILEGFEFREATDKNIISWQIRTKVNLYFLKLHSEVILEVF